MEDTEVAERSEGPREVMNGKSTAAPISMATETFFTIAVILYLAAIGLAIGGFVNAYFDSDYPHSIVGGDAYNYIIFATRGMVWMGGAIVSAICGLGCQVAGHSSARSDRGS